MSDWELSSPRKLTLSESTALKKRLASVIGNNTEDVNDLIEYALAMVSNQKTISYIVHELIGMEMEFLPQETANGMGNVVADYLTELKTKSATGNALCLAGALGVPRKGEEKTKKQEVPPEKEPSPRPSRGEQGKRLVDPRSRAFDRLSRGSGRIEGYRGRGRGRDRDGGRGRDAGRGREVGRAQDSERGRDVGRGRGERRRARDELEQEPDFVPAAEHSGDKRARYNEDAYYYEDTEHHNYDYDGGYGYAGTYRRGTPRGQGFRGGPPFRGGTPYRGGRGHRAGRTPHPTEKSLTYSTPKTAKGVDIVGPQFTYQEGRGNAPFRGRGRGRGRTFPGRAHVATLLASKQWVRKKGGEDSNDETGNKETS